MKRLFLLILILISRNLFSWHDTKYIWNFGLISKCTNGVPKDPYSYFASGQPFNKNDYKKCENGDIVWVKTGYLHEFCKYILPNINKYVILLISDGDESFPKDCKGFNIDVLLNNEFIVHIFVQNNIYLNSKKISSIPIGNDFHSIGYKGGMWGESGNPNKQEAELENIISKLKPTKDRIKGALVDFQLNDSLMHGGMQRYLDVGDSRTSIFNIISQANVIKPATRRMRRYELWAAKGQYAFSISPHGNGLDCHRTWEDLILGCIVIVKTSPLDILYEGLPVVIVNNWTEVAESNLNIWLDKYGDALDNPAYRNKLTNSYWWKKIEDCAEKIRGSNVE